MSRRRITHQQAMAWNPAWSAADRQVIQAHLDRLAIQAFHATKTYVSCVDLKNREAMTILPGRITFAPKLAPSAQAEADGIPLSTNSGRSPRTTTPRSTARVTRPEPELILCPVHFMALPASGVCDECG